MAARALASVMVTFGMVSIPVKLYAATQAQAGVSFNLLHAACGSRLKQQYLCARKASSSSAPTWSRATNSPRTST